MAYVRRPRCVNLILGFFERSLTAVYQRPKDGERRKDRARHQSLLPLQYVMASAQKSRRNLLLVPAHRKDRRHLALCRIDSLWCLLRLLLAIHRPIVV